ncbi:ABC transporter permease [Tunturiibacter empetritectus]|uniref:Permease n=1 Tax=Tunturiibacter lichenicola TaxID=2051959 RepID=A0A852VGK0_9BACT|nr:ABC transporter permease [Edaphobacter lichenicola]NYF91943.1 putative permease [Edaphobacter lichenicola]
MQTLLQNLRFAIRQLRKSPGFALTVVLTLALGIGANAAVFTLFDQALLRMLPVQHPKELVRFEWSGGFSGSASSFGGDLNNYFSYPMYKDLRDQNQVFSGMIAAIRAGSGISWHNQAEDEDVELVSGNYFDLLGLKPAFGRLMNAQDDTAKNANPVVVLSYDYWKTRFAASPDVVGQTVLIEGHPFTILGVAPANFQSAIGGYKPGAFMPISMVETVLPGTASHDNLNNHQSLWLTLVARLKPGVSPIQAQTSLEPLWHSLRAYELTLYKNRTDHFKKRYLDDSKLKVLDDSTGFAPDRMELKTPLIILMSMAGLLVAMCAINVATLLLLKASSRAREMSMRYALGAKQSRIVSQLLLEGGLLGLVGAAAGLLMAPLVTNTLVRLLTSANPGEEPYSSAIDARVLLFTLGVALVASLLFSMAPVLHFLRPDLANALRQSTGTASKSSQRFRKVAVGVQIALSVMLLGGAGLFVRTLNNLHHQQVGFDTSHLATFSFDPSDSGYGPDRMVPTVTNALDAVQRIPGVLSVAATNDAELAGDSHFSGFAIEGHKTTEDEKTDFEAPWITAGYFATLKQPLLVGREFTVADSHDAPKVAVVNLTFAKRFFGSAQNALGHLISESSDRSETPALPDTTIVGVVGDIKHQNLRTDMGMAVYRPYPQTPHPSGVKIYARTSQSPAAVESAIRQAIHGMDPTLVVDGMRTMDDQVDRITADERALALLAVGFSALAILLAAVGLYGVLAYSTEQRTREIGVRLALGSQRSGVVMLVLREMSIIAAIAIVVALPSIVLLARLFRSQLYGVTTADPITLIGAVALAVVMVTLAAVLPARRAASIEPMQALRTE